MKPKGILHGRQAIVCQGIYRSHRFDGQITCFRCGISALEVRRAQIRRQTEQCKAMRAAGPIASGYPFRVHQDPYAAGYDAFSKDLRNPFKPGTPQHTQWFEGWHTAATYIEKECV